MSDNEPLKVDKTEDKHQMEAATPNPAPDDSNTHSKRKLAVDEDIRENEISTKKAKHDQETEVTDMKNGSTSNGTVDQCTKIDSAHISDEVISELQPTKAESSDTNVAAPAPSENLPSSRPLTLLENIDMTQTCLSEEQVGIRKYINPNLPTFSAILKHRFTDFLVHEVDNTNQVVHLKDISDPRKKPAPDPETNTQAKPQAMNEWPSDADEKLLEILSGEKLALLKTFVSHGPPKGKNATVHKKAKNRHASSSQTKCDPEKLPSEMADVNKSPAPVEQPENKADHAPETDVEPAKVSFNFKAQLICMALSHLSASELVPTKKQRLTCSPHRLSMEKVPTM